METAATRHPDLAARLIVDPALRRGWLALAERAAADAALRDRSLLRAERLGWDSGSAARRGTLAVSALQTGRLDRADTLIAELIPVVTEAGALWVERARIAEGRGRTAAALRLLRRGLLSAPASGPLLAGAHGFALVRQDARLRLALSRRAAMAEPLHPLGWFGGAVARSEAGAATAAERWFRRCQILLPGHYGFPLELARHFRHTAAAEATSQSARALMLAPTQVHVLDMAFGLAAERGDGADLARLAARMTAAPEKTIAAAFLAPGDAVLDIGAFLGTTAHLFAAAGAGRIDCCEPNPDNVAVLRRSLPAVARIHPVALSATAGTVELAVPEGRAGAGSIDAAFAATANADRPEAVRRHRVEAARLDDLGLPAHRLWKIDVEGAELMVLDGAAASLRERPPACLLIEVFGPPLAGPERVDAVTRRVRRALPHRYQVSVQGGRTRLLPLLPGDAPIPHARLGTGTPLYLFSARPAPVALTAPLTGALTGA